MLGEKIAKYGTSVYLVNTGWAGGSAQELGKAGRMKLRYTRAMVTAALHRRRLPVPDHGRSGSHQGRAGEVKE